MVWQGAVLVGAPGGRLGLGAVAVVVEPAPGGGGGAETRLTSSPVAAAAGAVAMLVGMVSYDIAYLLVVLASAGMLSWQHRLNTALVIGVAVFVVVTVAVPAAVLGLKQWGQRAPIAWLSKWK